MFFLYEIINYNISNLIQMLEFQLTFFFLIFIMVKNVNKGDKSFD